MSHFFVKSIMWSRHRTKRKQILNIKHKFLNQTDVNNISVENISDITLIWTLKEAIYKLCQFPGIDFKDQIFVSTLTLKII